MKCYNTVSSLVFIQNPKVTKITGTFVSCYPNIDGEHVSSYFLMTLELTSWSGQIYTNI